MISTPFRFLKSKKLSSQKETFVKEIQVFAENLIKKKKKFEENASKELRFNPTTKENKELIQKKVLNFISKLSLKERMKLFTISNKWLVEVLIQLFSLYENNNRITFGLNDEMAPFINEENKCWKCGHEFHGDQYDLNSYYSTNLLDSKYIPSVDECSHHNLNRNSPNELLDDNESTGTDVFSYKLYFKIFDSLEEKEDKNRIQMESDILKYIKIVKPYDIITFDKELLLDFEKLKKFFEYFTQSNCFKDWIFPTENEQGKNFNLPKWVHKKYSLTFFQILITFFEQHILLNYEYYFYANRIYQTKYQENMEELYDEINCKVKQLNSETFLIDKIFSKTIIKTQINDLKYNNNNNNDELSANIYNELKNKIKEYNNEKEKVIKLLERLTFLDLDEVVNKRQQIYKSYKEFIFNALEDQITNELLFGSDKEKKEKKHKKNKKAKKKNKNEIKDDKNKIKEDNKEENKEIGKENQIVINEKKENRDTKENENKICKKEKKEKQKEFFLFTNFNKNKKNKPVVSEGKETNFKENKMTNSNDKIIRIISKTSLSTYKSSNDQDDIEDYSSIMSDMSDNVVQESNTTLESSPPKLDFQNSANNVIQYHMNNNINYCNTFQFYNNLRNIYNNWYNKFYDEGIETYCTITQNNVLILNNLKEKYFKIIIDDIIKKNLKEKYDLKFQFYGSSCTNLSIEGSDSDCCIFFKALIQNNLPFHEELYSLLKENEHKREDIFFELIPIFSTKIPRIIVKIDIRKDLKNCPLNNYYQYLSDDDMNNIKIDFTFTKDEEYLMNLNKNVQYVKNKLEIYPQLRPVLLILKRFFKNMGMNEVYKGGISSYSLFLLTLNSIYIYQKENPNFKITSSQLLIQVFKKYSYFKFQEYGIGIDNNEYNLDHENEAEILYILDPLTGKNIASVGKCTGKKVKEIFSVGFNQLCLQNNYFIQLFQYNRLFLMNSNPIISIVSLFNK